MYVAYKGNYLIVYYMMLTAVSFMFSPHTGIICYGI